MVRLKKRHLVFGIFSLLIFAGLFFLSAFTKNWLVKNSEQLIGRKLEIGELHFNYAQFSVQVKNLVLFEKNKTDSFASFNEFYINLNPWALLSREYSISEIRLVRPYLQINQDGEKFNFDSLIPKEDSLATKDTAKTEAIKFTIRDIQLIEGEVSYTDLLKNNQLEIKNLNLKLPLISWDNEQSNAGLDFRMGKQGLVNIQATVDNRNKKYRVDLTTQDIEILPITGYLTDYAEVSSVNGRLNSSLKIVGDMNEILNISITGNGSVADLVVLDGRVEKILSATEITATINDLNLKTFHFEFGKIEARDPNILFVRDKKMTNLERFLLPYFHSDSIGMAAAADSSEVSPVTYSIDTIKIYNGLVSITDNTLNRPFRYALNDLNLTMTGLTENADRIPLVFSTIMNNKGEFSGEMTWSMLNPMNLELNGKLRRMDLLSFSPYSEYYLASSINQGWFNYDLSLKITPTSLINRNTVKMEELEFGKRTRDTTAIKVPVRLGLYILKDVRDLIAFEIPVEGNPSEPKFKLGKIIWKTFANLMVKTALSPFNALSSLAGTNPESLEKLPFAFTQDSLNQSERDVLNKLATIMKKKPELNLILTQITDPEKEKTRIAVQLTKDEFRSAQSADSTAAPATTQELNDEDSNLLAFIRKTIPAVDSTGIEQACMTLVDDSRIESRFQTILERRNHLVTEYLTQNQGIPGESLEVSTADLKNLPQELRIPQFKIEVSLK